MKKVLLTTVMSLVMCIGIYAQEYEWKKPPKPSEIIIGDVSTNAYDGGDAYFYEVHRNGKKWGTDRDDRRQRPQESDEVIYSQLLRRAQDKYGKTYSKLSLRNFKIEMREDRSIVDNDTKIKRYFYGWANVVVTSPKEAAKENLSNAIGKAMRNVRQGSRIAIDQVTVTNEINREDYKDQLIDMLLDKGYKVVAKEYLQKLYKEQQNQQSGIYNEDTTVQESNFSAVGYYINVKVTETSLRVQVVNVSTGEYEGNATVNF